MGRAAGVDGGDQGRGRVVDVRGVDQRPRPSRAAAAARLGRGRRSGPTSWVSPGPQTRCGRTATTASAVRVGGQRELLGQRLGPGVAARAPAPGRPGPRRPPPATAGVRHRRRGDVDEPGRRRRRGRPRRPCGCPRCWPRRSRPTARPRRPWRPGARRRPGPRPPARTAAASATSPSTSGAAGSPDGRRCSTRDVVPAGEQRLRRGPAEHPAGAGDEDLHVGDDAPAEEPAGPGRRPLRSTFESCRMSTGSGRAVSTAATSVPAAARTVLGQRRPGERAAGPAGRRRAVGRRRPRRPRPPGSPPGRPRTAAAPRRPRAAPRAAPPRPG